MGDLSDPSRNIQELLEAEFCPPLDTTLVAAILADYLLDGATLGEDTLQTLREQLSLLAASAAADQDDLADGFTDLQISSHYATTEDSRDTDSVFDPFTTSSISGESSSQGSSCGSGSQPPSPEHAKSALDFLRASFPHLEPSKLRARVLDAEVAGELDMERIVEELLSEEYVKELEERGLEDEDELVSEVEKWTVVARKVKSSPISPLANKKKRMKGKTIAISDIRQKQNARPAPAPVLSAGDPWNQLTSISTYLETLLPPRQASFFLSFFHKPEYVTPAHALRAALTSIKDSEKPSPAETKEADRTGDSDQDAALYTLIEFIVASNDYKYDAFDAESRAQLCADADLALSAAKGSPDTALDIVKLLQDLDADKDNTQEMGIYHSPASTFSGSGSTFGSASMIASASSRSTFASPPVKSPTPIRAWTSPSSSPRSPAHIPLPPSPVANARPPPAPNQNGNYPNAWHQVRAARVKQPAVHPLAAHIPSYNPQNVPRRKGRARTSVPPPLSPLSLRGGYGSPTGTTLMNGAIVSRSARARITECRTKRDEALRNASRHWSNGSARTRGGEVALYYALEAQKLQEEARVLKLDAARELVDGKRFNSSNHDSVDLHYCTTAEAITIVHDVLGEGWVTGSRPLRIITGRGTHSTNGVGVLGPAIKNALEKEGWHVGKWEGGLVVNGRARG